MGKSEKRSTASVTTDRQPWDHLEFITTNTSTQTSAAPWDHLEFITTNSESLPGIQHIERVSDDTQLTTINTEEDTKSTKVKFEPVKTEHHAVDTGRLARIQSIVASSEGAVRAERKIGTLQGAKLYYKAIGWSVVLSLTIVMEGYDLTIVNSFFALPQFVQAYGSRVVAEGNVDDYQLSTAWQSALSNGAVVGEIIGLLGNGYLTDRLGYRYTLMLALVALCAFIFLAVFATSVEFLLISEVLCGLSWGVFQTLSTTYAAEIMPANLRAYLTSNVNLCWLLGQMTAVGVLRGFINIQSSLSYKIPFALQWAWAIPILIGVAFAPESPWLLVRKGKYDQAKKSLTRLTTRAMDFDVDESVALMKKTNEVEKQLQAGMTYLDCFKGVNLRRTEIACVVWMTQTLCGAPMTGYATYFYRQAGFGVQQSFDLSLGMYGMAIIGNIISWFLLPILGRRTSYLWGTGMTCLTLILGGIVGTQSGPWVSWVLGSLLILFTFIYDLTIGPVCYSLVAEIPSTRLRVKTVVLARVAYNLAGIIANVLMPKMLNPAAWNWRGKTCFLWAGTCFLCWVYCWFRLPEPKGLTYLEIDLLFERKVPPRKWHRVRNCLVENGYFDIQGADPGERNWRGVSG